MSFQALRVNAPIYILHKDQTPSIEIGTVVTVSAPMPKYQQPPMFGQMQEMVVDISARVGDQNINLQKLPAAGDIGDFGNNIVVSCSRDAMNAEVVSLKQRSVDTLNSVEVHKAIIAGCDKIIETLNPEFAERQKQEAENKALREEVGELKKMIGELLRSAEKTSTPLKKQQQ